MDSDLFAPSLRRKLNVCENSPERRHVRRRSSTLGDDVFAVDRVPDDVARGELIRVERWRRVNAQRRPTCVRGDDIVANGRAWKSFDGQADGSLVFVARGRHAGHENTCLRRVEMVGVKEEIKVVTLAADLETIDVSETTAAVELLDAEVDLAVRLGLVSNATRVGPGLCTLREQLPFRIEEAQVESRAQAEHAVARHDAQVVSFSELQLKLVAVAGSSETPVYGTGYRKQARGGSGIVRLGF